jgi:two-component system chemotaxis response regulator CheB
VDHCLALDAMANLLSRLSREPAPEQGESPVPDDMNLEVGVAGLDPSVIHGAERPGELSHFTCPECTGPLYQIEDGNLVRFRCRVGFSYTAESMLDEKDRSPGGRPLRRPQLPRRERIDAGLAAHARQTGQSHAAARFKTRARGSHEQAETIRRVLVDGKSEAKDTPS